MKVIQIFFRRLPKYAILIFKVEKIEHNKTHQNKVENENLF